MTDQILFRIFRRLKTIESGYSPMSQDTEVVASDISPTWCRSLLTSPWEESRVTCRKSRTSGPVWYLIAYSTKVVIVGLLAWSFCATWRTFARCPSTATLWLAALSDCSSAGLVGLDGLYPLLPFQGKRRIRPLSTVSIARWIFIVVRMAGLALLVP